MVMAAAFCVDPFSHQAQNGSKKGQNIGKLLVEKSGCELVMAILYSFFMNGDNTCNCTSSINISIH